MSTSLYGTVKKINSSCFVFDKIYNTRAEMEANKTTDGVYHGRYVLVTYGDRYSNVVASNPTVNAQGNIPSYILSDNVVYTPSRFNIRQGWLDHYNTDVHAYSNQYDNTVWQKIYEGTSEKYIMVASLNARAPGLTINEDYYSFNLTSGSQTFYTKYKTAENTYSSVKTQNNKAASYPSPKWEETISNDLIYHLDMPMPLEVNLGSFNYGAKHFTPTTHYKITASTNANNYVRWEHILKEANSNEVIGADFNFHVPRLGEVMGMAYDALYGVPYVNGVEQDNAARPTEPSQFTNALANTANVGIIGVLANLGLVEGTGSSQTYKLHADWDATSSQFGHVENKPKKITNISVASSGLWTLTVTDNA